MGFPFETASWDAASGAIFMGAGGSMPGFYAFVGIALAIAALVAGQMAEAKKYKNHK